MRTFLFLICLWCMPMGAYAELRTYTDVPVGFSEYVVQRGDTWEALTGSNEAARFAMKVNRIDARHLRVGMRVIVPVSDLAYIYTPVPRYINRNEPRHLVIFLDRQYFGAYEYGSLVYWGPISSGALGHETITGTFQALWKDIDHRSSKYNNAPMNYAVQFSGNYFTHEQALPGVPASHGCVRMLAEDARWKFHWIKVGDPISVIHDIAK